MPILETDPNMHTGYFSITASQSAAKNSNLELLIREFVRPLPTPKMSTVGKRGLLPTYTATPLPTTPNSVLPNGLKSDPVKAEGLRDHLITLQKFQYVMTLADKELTGKQWDEMINTINNYAWKTSKRALSTKVRIVMGFLNYDIRMLFNWQEWVEEEDEEGREISERGSAFGFWSLRGGGLER
ncbi:hypothetical protein L873DRAFT_1813498 [Choiromyces venosus 120613-1]|uniref:Uncharacterized protein n=1 Tax=Choiromyces venosus 120613-1 TaxID=1336337 RepID=A0A3N4J9I0_9PEZI|nr:hypothetical protein L873DRAFT_1813498 [Choiromyces venosus 120613-1]